MLLNTAVINFLFIAIHYYFYDIFNTNANRPNAVESCRLLGSDHSTTAAAATNVTDTISALNNSRPIDLLGSDTVVPCGLYARISSFGLKFCIGLHKLLWLSTPCTHCFSMLVF